MFFFWFSLPIPSLICFCLLCLADMLVMVGGLYSRRVLFRQMHSLQVKILCVLCCVCAYVFVQGSISWLLAHCGPHLALRTSFSPRYSKRASRLDPNTCPRFFTLVFEEGESVLLNCGSIQHALMVTCHRFMERVIFLIKHDEHRSSLMVPLRTTLLRWTQGCISGHNLI